MADSIHSRVALCKLLGLAFLCGITGAIAAQGSAVPTVVKADGISVVSVPLDAGHGGLLLPIPEAVLNTGEGTVAIRVNVAGFPGNGTVLDFGSEKSGRMVISEVCANADSRQGHFRLVVSDATGKQIVEGPVGNAGQSSTLAFTWHVGVCAFWVDGKSVGTVQDKNPWKAIPERLALVEPIGVRWERVEIWSEALADDKIQALVPEDRWTLDAKTTFLANREEKEETAQIGLIGPSLMPFDRVLAELQKPVTKRELSVDAVKGIDDGDGSAQRPFKTIAQAAKVAGPGDTVTVLPGTYRDSVTLTRSGCKDAPIVFQASPDGPVILNGTDPVGGFEAGGEIPGASLWVKSDFKSRDVVMNNPALLAQGPNGFRQLERRGRVDTLWSDGQLLSKAESHETLRPYSFWVDPEKKQLVLALEPGDRPDNHRMEIGARGDFFSGDVSYITLDGFRMIGADTSTARGAAIEMGVTSSNWIVQNIDENGGNWVGIIIHGWGHVLRHNVTDNNGDEGVAGSLCQYVLLDGNTCRYNNWQRGINPDWEAGGNKFTQADHFTVRNEEAAFNLGPGLWFDCNNANVTVEGGRFHNNAGDVGEGLFAEISPGPFIFRNNVCFDNEEAGISIGESSNVLIENNTLARNKYGIQLRNMSGRSGLYGSTTPGPAGPGNVWKLANVDIRRNIIAQNSAGGILNSFTPLDVVQDKITSDSNLFFRNEAMVLWPLKAGAGADVKLDSTNDWAPVESGGRTKLLTLDAVHKILGLEEHSLNADPKFRMPTINEYQVDMSGPAGTFQAGADFSSNSPSSIISSSH
jgi:parallel beta-helix repeat protein